jgi:hypothetical protein
MSMKKNKSLQMRQNNLQTVFSCARMLICDFTKIYFRPIKAGDYLAYIT